MKHFSYTNAKNSNDDIFISWIRQQEIHHYQIFKYHILLIYPQEFSFPFSLLTLFKFLSTRKTIFSIGCRTLFMYPDPRWYGMIPSVWNCRNLRHMKIYFEYQYVQILYQIDDQIIKYNINSYKYSVTYVLKTKIRFLKT